MELDLDLASMLSDQIMELNGSTVMSWKRAFLQSIGHLGQIESSLFQKGE